MPILKNAIKKLRADEKRTERNKVLRSATKTVIKKVRLSAAVDDLKAAFSTIDRAAKKGIFHKSKADRIKSRLSKLVAGGKPMDLSTPKKKKTVKKVNKKTKAAKGKK